MDFNDVAFLCVELHYLTSVANRNLNVGLVCHYFTDGLVLGNDIAFGHKPFDDFALKDALTNFRKFKGVHAVAPVGFAHA
jgi:hypothetical protein